MRVHLSTFLGSRPTLTWNILIFKIEILNKGQLKRLYFFLIAFLLVSTCCCGGGTLQKPDSATTQHSPDSVEHLFRSTVTLLYPNKETGEYRTICAGAWVSETKILTARHCAEAFLSNDVYTLFGLKVDLDKMIGIQIPYSNYEERDQVFKLDGIEQPHQAMVIGYDPDTDLALLETAEMTDHEILSLEGLEPKIKQKVQIVGHPSGIKYTYFEGIVSNPKRSMAMFYDDGKPHYVLHITSFVSPGNSGGPAADLDGNLLGICSYMVPRATGSSFFIRGEEIKDFLKRELVL